MNFEKDLPIIQFISELSTRLSVKPECTGQRDVISWNIIPTGKVKKIIPDYDYADDGMGLYIFLKQDCNDSNFTYTLNIPYDVIVDDRCSKTIKALCELLEIPTLPKVYVVLGVESHLCASDVLKLLTLYKIGEKI